MSKTSELNLEVKDESEIVKCKQRMNKVLVQSMLVKVLKWFSESPEEIPSEEISQICGTPDGFLPLKSIRN